METRQVRHLLVHNAEGVAGIVSNRDIRLIASSSAQACAPAAALRSMLTSEAMNPRVVPISPDASITEAAALLLDHGVDALLVVDDGTLIGVISEHELLEFWAARPRPGADRATRSGATGKPAIRRYRRVAIVGMETDEEAPAAVQTARIMSLGITVFPVHRTAVALLGVRCFPRIASVPGPVDVVQVFPRKDLALDEIVDETIAKKARVFWFEGQRLDEALRHRLDAAAIDVEVGHSLHGAYLGLRA
jgi:predicted CoA-binding protein